MTKYKFLKKPSETDEFSEASVHELRVLVALYESRGELDEAAFVESRSEGSQPAYTPDAYSQTPSYSSNAGGAPNFEDHNTDDDLPF